MAVKKNADGSLTVTAGSVTWTVSAAGSVSAVSSGGRTLVQRGPALMVLAIAKNDFTQLTEQNDRSYSPWTDTLGGWTAAAAPVYEMVGAAAVVNVTGAYTSQAEGAFQLTFDAAGGMKVRFDFQWQGKAVSPRQVGVVFDLPPGVDKLSWKRRGQFTY